MTAASSRFSYGNNDIATSSYTDYWREMRKMIVIHLFTPHKVRSFRSVREDEVSRLIDEISEKADSDELVNIGEMASSFACNLMCRVGCGKRLDEGAGSSKERRFDKIMDLIIPLNFRVLLDDYLPLFRWVNKISGAARRVDNLFEDMDSFYQKLIDENLNPSRPDSMKNDILDLLIQLRGDPSAPIKIDWEHVKALLMNVFVAGTETNAVTITWALTALIRNPSAMKKAQQEIRSLFGKKRSVDEDDIEKLPYLKAIVKETLRLYPAVPVVPRETTERCIIDGYEIQPKTLVLVNLWAIGRDVEYWENPNEFLPDRFLNTNTNFHGQDFGFLQFGAGRRICPGLHQGLASVELALANLLHTFDWEMPHGMTKKDINTAASIGIIMHKKNPLRLLAKSCL